MIIFLCVKPSVFIILVMVLVAVKEMFISDTAAGEWLYIFRKKMNAETYSELILICCSSIILFTVIIKLLLKI